MSAGELALREANRDSAARVSRLDYSAGRRAFEENSGVVDGPLQPGPTSLVLGSGCSSAALRLPGFATTPSPVRRESVDRRAPGAQRTSPRIPCHRARRLRVEDFCGPQPRPLLKDTEKGSRASRSYFTAISILC